MFPRKFDNCIHAWSSGPFATQDHPFCIPYQFAFRGSRLPMLFFAFFFACRVGEASNPGPIRMAVVNPTAVLKKVPDLMELGADIICAAETSATQITQQTVTKSFSQHGVRSFWSPPVASQFETMDGRPSFRGEALGSAVFTSLPARVLRVDIPVALSNSQRFSCAVVRIHDRDILFISLYGFAGVAKFQREVKMNDLLLTYVWDIIQRAGLPFVVAGDFNEPPHLLPIFKAFKEVGAVEVHQWYFNRFHEKLPATCRNATFNDTAIIHPWIAQFIQHVKVPSKFQMGDHTPLLIDFDFQRETDTSFVWRLPQSWAPFAPPKHLIEKHFLRLAERYEQPDIVDAQSGNLALLNWSKHVEHAIDHSFKDLHRFDSVTCPWNGLPDKFRGKCSIPTKRKQSPCAPIRGDRRNGYTPPGECFSLPVRLKTRQVRRLISLKRSLKSTRMDDQRKADLLLQEWKCIQQAKGYGRSWLHWALGFDMLVFQPVGLPTDDFLELAIAITKVDCDYAAHREMTGRQASFKYRIQVDKSDDFSKLSYQLIREQKPSTLQEVPATHSCEAVLCRSTKGSSCLKLIGDEIPTFILDASASFGDATIRINGQNNNFLNFSVLDGKIPIRSRLEQGYTACSNNDLFSEFKKFWSPYWLRDPKQHQFDDDLCQNFLQELQSIPLPAFPAIHVPIGDVDRWMDAVKQLKPYKAHGACAWRHEELKALPRVCIAALATIFESLAHFECTDHLMWARTTLLPKNDNPSSMNQIRPITIISALFRLFGKVIFRAVADSWAKILPWPIMGGLPGRGVKDLAMRQKLLLEDAIKNKTSFGGFSLGLIKAFNTFDRRILSQVLRRLGMPSHLVSFWITSISNLVRFPQVNGRLGEGLSSTVGAPEGDCISVLAMIGLSTLFYYKLKSVSDEIQPFAYADNWSWLSSSQKNHVKAMVAMLNLVHSLRVTVDYNKYWHFGVTKEFREISNDLQLLFPSHDVEIQVKYSAKDLGEVVCYSKKVPVDVIRARIDAGIRRIQKLRHLPLGLQDKCKLIQTSIWPMALYAAEFTYVGQKHFQDLRRAVVTCLIGNRKMANPWIACFAISKFLKDPLLTVITNIARQARRMATKDRDLFMAFLNLSKTFSGTKTYGPASTFRAYLNLVGWTLQDDGTIWCSNALFCNLANDSMKTIVQTFRKAWPQVLLSFVDRKGIGDYMPDPFITQRIFSSFSDSDQKLLAYYVLGAFQVEGIKTKWKHEHEEFCPLCGAPDTRAHRYLECSALADVRSAFPDAIGILTELRPEWVYLPIAREYPDNEITSLILKSFPQPKTFEPWELPHDLVTFYTDGGALHPNFPQAKVAAWSVIQDTSENEIQRSNVATLAFMERRQFPLLKTVAVGLLPGHQCSGRAEFFALLIAVRSAWKLPPSKFIRFVTDASYVVLCVEKICQFGSTFITPYTANADLLLELCQIWNPDRFVVVKIRSHQKFTRARNLPQLWDMLGNACADFAVSTSLEGIPTVISQLCNASKDWYISEKNWLLEVFRFVVALNKARIPLIEQINQTPKPESFPSNSADSPLMPSNLLGVDAINLLRTFDQPDYVQLPDTGVDKIPALEKLQLFLPGANVAWALCHWLSLLKWPQNFDPSYKRKDDWGISWAELYINFVQTTGQYYPVKISGNGASTVFAAFLSDTVSLGPKSKRSLSNQIVCFQRSLPALNTLLQSTWFPCFDSIHNVAIKHCGWDIQAAGIPCRPILPNQSKLMDVVAKFSAVNHSQRKLQEIVFTLNDEPQIPSQNLEELPYNVRFKKYMQNR